MAIRTPVMAKTQLDAIILAFDMDTGPMSVSTICSLLLYGLLCVGSVSYMSVPLNRFSFSWLK